MLIKSINLLTILLILFSSGCENREVIRKDSASRGSDRISHIQALKEAPKMYGAKDDEYYVTSRRKRLERKEDKRIRSEVRRRVLEQYKAEGYSLPKDTETKNRHAYNGDDSY